MRLAKTSAFIQFQSIYIYIPISKYIYISVQKLYLVKMTTSAWLLYSFRVHQTGK